MICCQLDQLGHFPDAATMARGCFLAFLLVLHWGPWISLQQSEGEAVAVNVPFHMYTIIASRLTVARSQETIPGFPITVPLLLGLPSDKKQIERILAKQHNNDSHD
jgi:hypothetical protein